MVPPPTPLSCTHSHLYNSNFTISQSVSKLGIDRCWQCSLLLDCSYGKYTAAVNRITSTEVDIPRPSLSIHELSKFFAVLKQTGNGFGENGAWKTGHDTINRFGDPVFIKKDVDLFSLSQSVKKLLFFLFAILFGMSRSCLLAIQLQRSYADLRSLSLYQHYVSQQAHYLDKNHLFQQGTFAQKFSNQQ